jgi:cbb3-type cytochrome oxidase subunit 1
MKWREKSRGAVMTRISDRFLQLGVLFALAGMGLGVWMGKTEDFQLQAVHAHINLLGWVSMLLYGLVYRVIPKAAEGRLPVVHFWLALASVLGMIPLLSLQLMGQKSVVPFLAVDMIALWLSMLLFAVIIFKATARGSAAA